MIKPANFDINKLFPKPTETPFEYWLSLSPAAPMFGLTWRFADMMPDARSVSLMPGYPVERKAPVAGGDS